MKKFLLLFILLLTCSIQANEHLLPLQECLLPKNHPLHKELKNLKLDSIYFESQQSLRNAGFYVYQRMHRGLMVFKHPKINNIIFKKFVNATPLEKQLKNFQNRVTGARLAQKFIKKEKLDRIFVPKKWIFKFKNDFILVAEEANLCGGENCIPESIIKYSQIDEETLRQLCLVVFQFRGLDSMIHNMPFTQDDKIAFIDTEKWSIKRDGYLKMIWHYLPSDKQAFALSVFEKME